MTELKHQEEAEACSFKSARTEVDRLREKLNHLERALADSDENRRLEQVGAEMDRLRDKREVVTKELRHLIDILDHGKKDYLFEKRRIF